jgi:hypothetical protein
VEFKSRYNSWKACYHSVQNPLSSRLLYRNIKITIYGAINVSFGSYGYGILRSMFGPKRDEILGDSRKTYNEALQKLYSSPNKIRMIKSRSMRRAGMYHAWGLIGVGKPQRKRPLGRPTYR